MSRVHFFLTLGLLRHEMLTTGYLFVTPGVEWAVGGMYAGRHGGSPNHTYAGEAKGNQGGMEMACRRSFAYCAKGQLGGVCRKSDAQERGNVGCGYNV